MRQECFEPWRPREGEWDRATALHLLRRAGFGAAPGELERALSEGLEATLERLFAARPDGELHDSIQPLLATGDIELLQAWWMSLMVAGGGLRERMTLVWHDHFATSNDKVADVRAMYAQNELFRTQGLGDFRVLLRAVARDPAMLVWLDGDSNRRGHPNENLAREWMELFALGRGHYDEHDVQEAARAFSGRGTAGRAFAFRPELHDDGPKTILGRTGSWDGDDVVDLVLARPACAVHIVRTLLQAFVGPRIEGEWVEALAATLRESEWDIGRAMHVLLRSRLFFSPAARRARIAGPVELLAVAARALDARTPPRTLARLAGQMGQALFRPPSVKGWDGGRAWIHAGHWIARHNALIELVEHARLPSLGEVAPEELTRSVIEAHVPDRSEALAEGLGRLARAADGPSEARATMVALVLTSPEYQLF